MNAWRRAGGAATAGLLIFSTGGGVNASPSGQKMEAAVREIRARPPVLLVHGERDDLIPAQSLFMAAQTLGALDIPVEWHLSPGIGHGIDAEGLRHGGEFLSRAFLLRT